MALTQYCEIVEVSHIEDTLGYPSGREALGECSDCGTHVCREHAERCSHCEQLFCISCLNLHETTLSKKPAREDGRRVSEKKLA